MVVAEKMSDEPTVLEVGRREKRLKHWRHHLRRYQIRRNLRKYRSSRPSIFDGFSDDRSAYDESILSDLPPSDVINLHWIAGFVDYGLILRKLTKKAPVFWTLHDMNPFTGGCHYAHDCEKFSNMCGACPQLGSNNPDDLSSQIWHRKAAYFKEIDRSRLNIITLNKWMADRVALSSLMGGFPVSIIPNGVDMESFSPCDQVKARKGFLIPSNLKIILFVADDISNPRKGFSFLMEALNEICPAKETMLVTVGRNVPSFISNIPHLHLGYLKDKELLARAYNAADVLIIPSSQDNQPNTILESLACGTPVISLAVGGMPEIVQEGVTGRLVTPGNVKEMSMAIQSLLKDDEGRKMMRPFCRNAVINNYAPGVQVKKYIDLYETKTH